MAIVQPRMHWTGEQNTAEIVAALVRAAGLGARLCRFGWHAG